MSKENHTVTTTFNMDAGLKRRVKVLLLDHNAEIDEGKRGGRRLDMGTLLNRGLADLLERMERELELDERNTAN